MDRLVEVVHEGGRDYFVKLQRRGDRSEYVQISTNAELGRYIREAIATRTDKRNGSIIFSEEGDVRRGSFEQSAGR